MHLRDSPSYVHPATTPPVGILRNGLLRGGAISDEYRRVVVPMDLLLKGARDFQTNRCAWVVFSGDGRAKQTYWIDDIRFHLDAEDVEADEPATTGGALP